MPKYIDADAFKKYVHSDWDIVDYADVMKALREFPTADVRENVRGKWIVKGQEIYCSKCNSISGYNWHGASAFSNFCPNCGADMQGGKE